MLSDGRKSPSNNGCRVDSQKATNNLSADLKALTKSKQQQLSNSNQHGEDTRSSSAAPKADDNVQSYHSTPSSTPTASPQNSPSRASPAKASKNKKKNEAKRRSANLKKQQQKQTKEPLNSANEIKQTAKSDDSAVTKEIDHESLMNSKQSTKDIEDYFQTKSKRNKKDSNQSSNSQQEMDNSTKTEGSEGTIRKVTQQKSDDIETKEIQLSTRDPSANNGQPPMNNQQITVNTQTWARKQRENQELKEQLKQRDSRIHDLTEQIKFQIGKYKEIEASLLTTTKACKQFEQLVQQELTTRTRIEKENETLNQIIIRLKSQIISLEKERSSNSELIRTLNATLIERETEVSILKLKMTRIQAVNSTGFKNVSGLPESSNDASAINNKTDPAKAFLSSGRSNSEFSRNSYARASMLAESSISARSTSRLQQTSSIDRDASVWAQVPEELTPSKRPLLLERNLQHGYNRGDANTSRLEDPPVIDSSPTFLSRDSRRYKTLPKSIKSPEGFVANSAALTSNNEAPKNQSDIVTNLDKQQQPTYCLITNLDESNSTNQSSNKTTDTINDNVGSDQTVTTVETPTKADLTTPVHKPNIIVTNDDSTKCNTASIKQTGIAQRSPSSLPSGSPAKQAKVSTGLKKILNVFRRSDSTVEASRSDASARPMEVPTTPTSGPFQRGATRSTLVGLPGNARGTSIRSEFHSDKPFAEWNTDMIVDWLTTIGLSMYASQCRRWVKCGAHIMNATPAEVDKGLGITNHIHRKKLRLAISELNGDSDKVTKAASKLDYLWVARWLDDIGLPQYKEAFINARIDGRVLNYLTVEDLFSLGIKSILHHSSIKCGIKVLRSINFDISLLKRRASPEETAPVIRTQDEAETSNNCNPSKIQTNPEVSDLQLWTCHRVMEWLRTIDFAEFSSNLRGSGLHGGLIVYEDAFNIDTMSSLLGIQCSKTLLRRHLGTFFDNLIGVELVNQKQHYKATSTSESLDPKMHFKNPKKSPLWFGKLKGSKVSQDGSDEYLCPMYPVDHQIIKSPTKKKVDVVSANRDTCSQLPRIPESINV